MTKTKELRFISRALSKVGIRVKSLMPLKLGSIKIPNNASECERDLNDCLTMNHSRWRIVDGHAMLVDSEYLHTEVRARTLCLLKEGRAIGALEEFQEAIQDLQTGETKDAVVKAHKSIESVMKTVLDTSEHMTFGKLLDQLIKSGLIPAYYQEFLIHFEKLALGAVKERNRPGTGHGQGNISVDVPRSLAEFVINLAGSVNLFIIERWLESKSPTKSLSDIGRNHAGRYLNNAWRFPCES